VIPFGEGRQFDLKIRMREIEESDAENQN
jgi:hypothetical protein